MFYKMVNPNTRIDWIPVAGLTTPSAPKATELNAGTRISGALETGYTLKFSDSETDASKTVEDEGNVETPTLKNYEGKLTFFQDDVGSGTAAPSITLGATATTGGTFAAGTYYWVVAATSASGDSLTSNEVSATVAANGTQVLDWTAVTGATGYKVYRGSSAGGQNVLVTTLGAVATYTDTGAAGTAGSPTYRTSIFTTATDLFKVPYVEGWLVSRYGRKATVAYAAQDKVSVFRMKNDFPRFLDGEPGNPTRVEVEFFPQGEAFANVVAVA
ncbi:hypothetical protein [uncultured Arthrobacter sp.]|uniref:phage tail tube protein n=1 Tax=uncultured Arthrobacter sp. TaxID=114050 RepID=UPI003217E368